MKAQLRFVVLAIVPGCASAPAPTAEPIPIAISVAPTASAAPTVSVTPTTAPAPPLPLHATTLFLPPGKVTLPPLCCGDRLIRNPGGTCWSIRVIDCSPPAPCPVPAAIEVICPKDALKQWRAAGNLAMMPPMPPLPPPKPLLRPLLVRPGARFACSMDGFCCMDMHLLGPLSDADVARARAMNLASVYLEPTEKKRYLSVTAGGECVLLDRGRCMLHETGGPLEKPDVCRAFPFELVRTPMGGRVATRHRCPCRTMGERPPIDPAEVEASLVDRAGRLRLSGAAPERIPLTERTTASFATYAALEAGHLARLAAGEPAAAALGVRPGLPRLPELEWYGVAKVFADHDGARPAPVAQAITWFGHGLFELLGEPLSPSPARPWRDRFDRAEARTAEGSPGAILADWAADLLWGLGWLSYGSFDRARVATAALHLVAATLAARFVREGQRPDRAAAEAVLIAELSGGTPMWRWAVASMDPAREVAG
jgi:Putative zinc- or iron-chelating domain